MGLLPGYVQNPKWYVSRMGWAGMFQRLAMAGGGNTIQTLGTGEGMVVPQYMGFPVIISQVMQSVQTTLNDLVMCMFGDLNLACSMGDRRGIVIARDTSTYFTTDQIALKATERVDIKCHNLGDATTPGAIVAMIGTT
jgi:HK97 family phage major capsid protein